MKRLAFRLVIALATFFFAVSATAALRSIFSPARPQTAPVKDENPVPRSLPFAFSHVALPEMAAPPRKEPRISQQEIVNFPGVGEVRVTANEGCDVCPDLEFRDPVTNKFLDSSHFGSGDDHSLVRFRVMHIKGLPDPMIVGVEISPGGSDAGWASVAVGAVHGELRELTHETLEASNQGGFYYGDLGGGRGLGAIGCSFIWGEGEGHYQAHQYELKVYTWDKKSARFEWHQVLRTCGEFDSGEQAARSLGFRFQDVRKSFSRFEGFALE